MLVISLGGFSEEAEIPGIKYILSPYKVNLVATPLFLKPGIPFSVKVEEGWGGTWGWQTGRLERHITEGTHSVKPAPPVDADRGGKLQTCFRLRSDFNT